MLGITVYTLMWGESYCDAYGRAAQRRDCEEPFQSLYLSDFDRWLPGMGAKPRFKMVKGGWWILRIDV